MKDKRSVQFLQALLLAGLGGFVFGSSGVAQDQTGGIKVQDCVVRFAAEIQVPALETGRVAHVHVQANDAINVGQPIARLDDQTLLMRRKAAQTRLVAAQTDADSVIELQYAEAALKEANAEYKLNSEIQEKIGGSIARQRMRQLSLSVERGVLEVAQARQRIDHARVELDLRQAEVAMLDDQLKNLHVDSPLDGVVLSVDRSAGEWIEKGQPIATVAQIDRLHVHALIDSAKISPMTCRNLLVTVTWIDPSTNRERVLQGRVLSVDPQRLPGARFRLHAEIVNRTVPGHDSAWLLHPGTDVEMIVHPAPSTAQRAGDSSHR
ncbi:MAG: HlyD family efflux transporter periplasmic adaptor subunit [Pirellulaceae bacterium]|nr:HlyD family efflux transporter periplasmic adaptor subunit [Pirellulaceae bacterium]